MVLYSGFSSSEIAHKIVYTYISINRRIMRFEPFLEIICVHSPLLVVTGGGAGVTVVQNQEDKVTPAPETSH